MTAPSDIALIAPEGHIRTASGRVIRIDKPGDIHWPDVCEHLAKIAMWNGASPGVFYSVAQRACHLHDAAPPDCRAHALLSVSHLAYVGPIHTPGWTEVVHRSEKTWDDVEAIRQRLAKAICDRAGIAYPPPLVRA